MKFAVSFIAPVVALRVAVPHPTVNLVLTNDNAADSQFSLAQSSKSKNLREELRELIKDPTHASLMEGDFNQPDVIRINYETPHAMFAESQNIVRESVSADAPYEEGIIDSKHAQCKLEC